SLNEKVVPTGARRVRVRERAASFVPARHVLCDWVAPLMTGACEPAGAAGANVPVTGLSASIGTVHPPVPLHPPPVPPANVDPGAGEWVSAHALPSSTSAAQVAPRAMPGGAEPTVPAPAPAFTTLSWNGSPSARNTSGPPENAAPLTSTLRSGCTDTE